MDYTRIKHELKEIVEIVETIPEKYQERCFDILVESLLSSSTESYDPMVLEPLPTSEAAPKAVTPRQAQENTTIPLSTPLKVFMRRHKISLKQLEDLLHVETEPDGKHKVHFIHEPDHTTPIAAGQIRWSLLLALKHTIETGNDFVVDPEQVREMCKTKSFYDAGNFAGTFKRNKELYKDIPKPSGPPQPLSDQGEAALAELIVDLTGIPI